MTDIVSPLLDWLNAHPQLAGLVTFIISAAESVAIIGTIVPGTIMMTALGTLAGAGVIPLWKTLFWAIMGAIVGDGISYWIGHYFKNRLPLLWPFRYYPNLLASGEKFFHRFGSMSVFIGRFVGPVRALVPLVAGMLGMKPLHFTLANVASAILWAPAYMLPGILLGAASLELPPDIAIHVILVLFLMTLFFLLCLWFIYKIFKLVQRHLYQLQKIIWSKLKTSRYFSSATRLLRHPHPEKTHGQFNLALLFSLTVLLFLLIAIIVKIKGPNNIGINDAIYHLFRGLSVRTPKLDKLLVMITFFGQKQVILPVVVAIIAWFLAIKRYRLAGHILLLTLLTTGSIFILKHLLQIPRPWGIHYQPGTYSMPSGHSTVAIVFYLGIALLINSAFKPCYRWPLYTLSILMTLAIGLSRLYLGAHWFSDIMSSFLLGAALLIFITISYRRQFEKPIQPWLLFTITFFVLSASYSSFYLKQMTVLANSYQQMHLPAVKVNNNVWWTHPKVLSTYRVSLFGFPSQFINLQWTGDIEEIRNTLMKEGWTKPPARDVISTLHRLADVESTAYLPLVSPQYLDRKPTLILTRFADNKKILLTIRLWYANRIISETAQPIWVGIINVVPRSYSWIYKRNPSEIVINPNLIFPLHKGAEEWQWKIETFKNPVSSLKKPLRIMYIRKKIAN